MSEVRKVIDNLVHRLWVDHGCPEDTVELDTKRAQEAEKVIEQAFIAEGWIDAKPFHDVQKALNEAPVPTEGREVGWMIPNNYMTGPEVIAKLEGDGRIAKSTVRLIKEVLNV